MQAQAPPRSRCGSPNALVGALRRQILGRQCRLHQTRTWTTPTTESRRTQLGRTFNGIKMIQTTNPPVLSFSHSYISTDTKGENEAVKLQQIKRRLLKKKIKIKGSDTYRQSLTRRLSVGKVLHADAYVPVLVSIVGCLCSLAQAVRQNGLVANVNQCMHCL